MAASEVAISLVIKRSLNVLSEREVLSPGLHDQINTAVSHLQNILISSQLLQSGTDNNQRSSDHGSGLLAHARDAGGIADKFLLEASPHSRAHRGRLAKIRALVHFMSLKTRVFATRKIALNFITRVQELATHLSQMQDLPPYDLLTLDENTSLRNGQRGNVLQKGKVESDTVVREDEAHELIAQLTLKDGNRAALGLRIISVVGEEAVGKTALVRSVYNRLEIDHIFQCRVWVHDPEELTLKGILLNILKQTPLQELKDLEHLEEENLKENLHKSLMNLRYLIVFDNIRKAEDMDELMVILADSRNGSRVVVTTRNAEISKNLDPWASPIELNELDENQSKRLLGECGSIAEGEQLTARILSKCSGSPPKILLLGGLAAASSDSSPVTVDQLADNPTLHDVMYLIYRKLPSQLKLCLLYLCLFPKNSEISTRRLFQLWLAEGLVKFTATEYFEELIEARRFTATECFEELVSRNLVHVVRWRKLRERPKSCRLPSFLRDFLCKNAMQFGLLHIHSDTMCTYHGKDSKVVNGYSWIAKYQENNYHQEPQKSAGPKGHQEGNIQL